MDTDTVNRRSFLVLTGAGLVGFLYAGVRFLGRPKRDIPTLCNHSGAFESASAARSGGLVPTRRPDGSYEIAEDAVEKGQGAVLAVAGAPLMMVRGEKSTRVFNATCTHLGCLVKWEASSNRFFCPCHGGIYNADGKVLSGPPPAALKEHKVKVADGKVVITVV